MGGAGFCVDLCRTYKLVAALCFLDDPTGAVCAWFAIGHGMDDQVKFVFWWGCRFDRRANDGLWWILTLEDK